MITFSNYLFGALLLAVTLALFLGLANMLRGGSPSRSQLLMRWRVGLQLAAILVMVGAFFLRK
jgi:hypothetical protein